MLLDIIRCNLELPFLCIVQIYMWIYMIKCAVHQVLRLPNYILSQDCFIFTTIACNTTFWIVFSQPSLTNFLVGGNRSSRIEKTHEFRQNAGWLFAYEFVGVARIEPTNSEVKGVCSDDYAMLILWLQKEKPF
jgi:hypothetical protein